MGTVKNLVRYGDEAGGGIDDAEGLIRLGMGFWASKVLFSAIELNLFTEIASNGPGTADDMVARLGLHGRGSLDFLDALVALGVLERTEGLYDNTPLSALHLDRNRPQSYLGHFFEFAGTEWYPAWMTLTEALRTGKPQNNGKDMETDPFDAIYADPDRLRRFQRMQSSMSLGATLALTERFEWARYRTVADIGSSEGAFLIRLLGKHEHLKGIGFDLPRVGPVFAESVTGTGLDDRLDFVAGDFFIDPLPRADVLSFGHILHDWDLETRKMLIRKAYEALPEGGAVILREALIDDDRRSNALPLLVSLHMLIETPGGADYTGADASAWLTEAGFRDVRVEALAGSVSMVTAKK